MALKLQPDLSEGNVGARRLIHDLHWAFNVFSYLYLTMEIELHSAVFILPETVERGPGPESDPPESNHPALCAA